MNCSVSFDKKGNLIQKGNKEIDSGLRFFFSKRGDKELLFVFLDKERCLVAGSRSQGNVGDREHISSSLVNIVFCELEGRVLIEHFSEEHGGC